MNSKRFLFEGVGFLRNFSFLPWLLLPILVILPFWLFQIAWDFRAESIRTQLCIAYFPQAAESDDFCGGLPPEALVIRSTDGWHTTEFEFTGALLIAQRLRNIREPGGTAGEGDDDTPLDAIEARCAELSLARFSFHPLRYGYTQNASYDSIARVIEACTQSTTDDEERPIQLCAGTRNPLNPATCTKSLTFAQSMQTFDRGEGAWVTTTLVGVAILFGVFQLIILSLAIWGLWSAWRLRNRVFDKSVLDVNAQAEFRNSSDLVKYSANTAAQTALSATRDVAENKREQTYNTIRDTYVDAVARKFKRIEVFGDLVVLLGLLGTLYGMLVLFAALAETGSADPLTAELASSRMLGSLGLAFGTTIFAAGLRFALLLTIPQLRDPSEIEIKNRFSAAFVDGLNLPGAGQSEESGDEKKQDIQRLPTFESSLPELDTWNWQGVLGPREKEHQFPLWAIAALVIIATLVVLFSTAISEIDIWRPN